MQQIIGVLGVCDIAKRAREFYLIVLLCGIEHEKGLTERNHEERLRGRVLETDSSWGRSMYILPSIVFKHIELTNYQLFILYLWCPNSIVGKMIQRSSLGTQWKSDIGVDGWEKWELQLDEKKKNWPVYPFPKMGSRKMRREKCWPPHSIVQHICVPICIYIYI